MNDHPAWPAIEQALLMARRHAIQKDVVADAEFLLKTALEVVPYLTESEDDDEN